MIDLASIILQKDIACVIGNFWRGKIDVQYEDGYNWVAPVVDICVPVESHQNMVVPNWLGGKIGIVVSDAGNSELAHFAA